MWTKWTTWKKGAAAMLGAALVMLGACSAGVDLTKAQVRMVNASEYDALEMRVDNATVQGGVTYGSTDAYAEINPSKAATEIGTPSAATPLLSFTPSLSKKKYYSLLAYGARGALKQMLLDDNSGDPDTDRAFLRVVNAASGAGAVDVYLTSTNEPLANAVPVISGVAADSGTAFLSVRTADWRLRVTAAGSKTDVRLDLSTFLLGNKAISTLVLVPGEGGALLKALTLAQQGPVAKRDGTQARVRLAAGLAAGTVSASVAGMPLVTASVSSPSVGDYVLVPAGTVAPQVKVSDQDLAVAAMEFKPGVDYTLLVHGATGAEAAARLVDVNRAPADANQVSIRLVNGASGLVQPLTMKVDSASVAESVAAGTASVYATTASKAKALLVVVPTGGTAQVFNGVDQVLSAGGVYSVFVMGGPPASGDANQRAGLVTKDR